MCPTVNFRWRQMETADLDRVAVIAGAVHPAYPEDPAIFAERLLLYPAGCRVLEMGGGIAAYVLSHPWLYGDPPRLNRLLGALPVRPTTYYIHDLALLPEARGTGAASAVVGHLAGHAAEAGFGSLSLVAVNASAGFWVRHGFRPVADPDIDDYVQSYDSAAQFMVRQISARRPLAILTAIPEEIAAFGPHLVETGRETVAGIAIHHGQLDGRKIVLAESGIGKVNGALAAAILFDRFDCRGIIFSGVAGGLDPALSVGDLVVATDVVQHDYGAFVNGALDVYRAGSLPFPEHRGEPALIADARLIAGARAALAGGEAVHFGTILTGDAYLGCGATRQRLFNDFAAKAVDMESGAVAQVAEAFGAPWLIIRALSDLAGEDSQRDFQSFVRDAAVTASAAVLKTLPLFDADCDR